MPNKNQKAAARQSKTREKRKRGNRAPQQFQAAPTQRKDNEDQSEKTNRPLVTSTSKSSNTNQPVLKTARTSKLIPAEYPYLKIELIRIGTLSSIIFLAIGILNFTIGN